MTLSVFSYGFRPFFLGAGIYATLAVPAALCAYLGLVEWPADWPVGLWHAHEMLFGYAVAAVVGFMLTAVPGWQKSEPVAGPRLAALAAVWLAGRLAMWGAGWLPAWLVTALDVAFLPLVIALGLPALWLARSRRHRLFLAVLGLLTLANVTVHAEAAGFIVGDFGIDLALDTLALTIAILGGRVVPAFTTGALKSAGLRDAVAPNPIADRVALATVAAFVAADVVANLWPGAAPAAGGVALAAAAANGWRMAGWATRHTLGAPIVWVLHLGYAWLVIGLAAKGLAGLGMIELVAAQHLLAIGAIGTMTLAIMTRAGLGHTGRPIVAPPAIVAAYGLVSLAAISRVVATSAFAVPALVTAAAAWTLAFGLFTAVYWPILTRPRPDGRPG